MLTVKLTATKFVYAKIAYNAGLDPDFHSLSRDRYFVGYCAALPCSVSGCTGGGMSISSERREFSARLKLALTNVTEGPASPTVLARNFNSRYPWQPITVHAARKWLLGEAIPTQDKLRVIAEWLAVSVMWLRYGEGEGAPVLDGPQSVESYGLNIADVKLLEDVRALKDYERRLVTDLVQMFLQNQPGKNGVQEPVSQYRADDGAIALEVA
jgi:hypothetical protein